MVQWKFNLVQGKGSSNESAHPIGMIIDRENTSQLVFDVVKKKESKVGSKQITNRQTNLEKYISDQKDINLMRQKQAWEFSYSPIRSLFMSVFLFYMQGSSIHIIMLFILFSNLYTPIKAIMSVNSEFKRFESHIVDIPSNLLPSKYTPADVKKIKDQIIPGSLVAQKCIYVFCTSLQVVLCLYKMHTIGLLPTPDDFIPIATPFVKEKLSPLISKTNHHV